MYNLEHQSGDIENVLHEVVEAIDNDQHCIIIYTPKRTMIVKQAPTEDVMTAISDNIWQIPD